MSDGFHKRKIVSHEGGRVLELIAVFERASDRHFVERLTFVGRVLEDAGSDAAKLGFRDRLAVRSCVGLFVLSVGHSQWGNEMGIGEVPHIAASDRP